MTLRCNITRRSRRRPRKDGTIALNERFVLNYVDPRTGQRHQLFFTRKTDALARRDALLADYQAGATASPQRASVTVREAVERWLKNRQGEVRPGTLEGYRIAARYITGPVIRGTSRERYAYATAAVKPPGVEFLPVLGHFQVKDLTTSDIRVWHKTLWTEVGGYSANRAKMFLKTALGLTAEDFNIRAPTMPALLSRGRVKRKKTILEPRQVSALLIAAREDDERGIYVAFPFLAGTRPSEQLGLLWSAVDFEKKIIRICRTQTREGQLVEMTKTEAGTREISMGPGLRQMLLEWRVRCPRLAGDLYRVFPGLGRHQAWPMPRLGAGGTLEYHNFLHRMWRPFFKRHDLPYVTPHSARHTYISVMQMQGVEVGLVAQLAGHSNPNVTLGHYTQAVRGGADAAARLEEAFSAAP
jgi:integrase